MKNTLSKYIVNCLTGLALLFLAGCSGAANFADGDTQKRNEVQMVRIPYMVTFEADKTNLSDSSIESLDIFLMKSNVSYGDELSMDFPLERDGSLSEQNQKRLLSLAVLLKKRGLRLSSEVTPYGMTPSENQARFLISRYLVTPPQCGDWSQPSTPKFGNASHPNFGCTTQANLGLMVANPRDLVTGTDSSRHDATKAAKAVSTYRTKNPAKTTSGATSGKKK